MLSVAVHTHAASQGSLATWAMLAALAGVADPATVRATAEQALGQEVLQRAVPLSRSTPAAPLEEGARLGETHDRPPR